LKCMETFVEKMKEHREEVVITNVGNL